MDLDAVVACLPPPPPHAEILDVGGGDGALVDRILARHEDARATLVDRSEKIGLAIAPARRTRVRLLPATRARDARPQGAPCPDWVLVSDVLHHVPREARPALLREACDVAAGASFVLIVKEVAPGGARARLAWLADRWISGDRGVRFLTREELRALVAQVLPGLPVVESGLYEQDRPNDCIWVRVPAQAGSARA